jgi:hypothetical protein
MTFTVMTPRQPCSFPAVLALSGPLLTYGLAYAGIFLLRSSRLALFAYALIFASFAHLRFIQTLSGRGDELLLAAGWSLPTNRTIVAAVVLLIGIPPLVAAYRVIANRQRNVVFIASWLLPLPVLVALLLGDKYLFETTQLGMRFGAFSGIWLTVLVTDLAALTAFIWLAPRYLSS